jgi:uncharacterized protein YjbI with pentapeptide repeats
MIERAGSKLRWRKRKKRQKTSPALRELPIEHLKQVLADHREWLDSSGESGRRADLSYAQLQGYSLWRADLREANLSYAALQGANLDHARLRGANLRHARLETASLWEANLCNADLTRAGLQRAKLDHADLSGANLRDADLTGASMWGARLAGTRLEGAVGTTDEQLSNTHLT